LSSRRVFHAELNAPIEAKVGDVLGTKNTITAFRLSGALDT